VELKEQDKVLAPPKTIEEIYRGLVKNDIDALRMHAYIDEEYKNDETTRKKHHLWVDAIQRSLLEKIDPASVKRGCVRLIQVRVSR
jgi:hypothetical protein